MISESAATAFFASGCAPRVNGGAAALLGTLMRHTRAAASLARSLQDKRGRSVRSFAAAAAAAAAANCSFLRLSTAAGPAARLREPFPASER